MTTDLAAEITICPQCGSNNTGEGEFKGYSVLHPVKKSLGRGSAMTVILCTDCGRVLSMNVNEPHKFK